MTTQTLGQTQLDQSKMEAFAGKMLGAVSGAFMSPLFSIGHRLGMFDRLAGMKPATSPEIAKALGLQERYVREWLATMVTGGVIEYDPAGRTYRLPPEHAAFLTRAAGPNNFAFFHQYTAIMGAVEPPLTEAFKNGGGVPYSAYGNFQPLQAEESARLFDMALVSVIVPFAPGVTERLKSGIDAVDVATGQGHAVTVLAKEFPKSRFLGLDFSDEGVTAGRTEAVEWGLKNARFDVHDVAKGIPGKFDLVTAFDCIHDMAKPRQVLKNIAQALKPGGVFLMMDMAGSSKLEENIANPMAPLLYAASTLHCMTVSLSQGGEAVGTMWGEQKAQEYLRDAGFKHVEIKRIPDDPMHVFYVCTV